MVTATDRTGATEDVTAVDLDALDVAIAQYKAGGWEAANALLTTIGPALPELLAEARRYRALRDAVDGLAGNWQRRLDALEEDELSDEAYALTLHELRAVVAALDQPTQSGTER